MKIFVTGATGKIGSRYVPRLLELGHNITILVRDSAKAVEFQKQDVEVIVGDLLHMDRLPSVLKGMDAVIHLAAQFRRVDEHTARVANIDASIRLAEAALKANVQRFVFASTNLVYGAGAPNRPSLEEDEVQPALLYPQTKVAAEKELLRMHREQGMGLRIVRLAFVYGEGDPHITEFMPIMSKWNPAKRLHMVHHADVSVALLLAASRPDIDGRIYNVADDSPISVAELMQLHGLPNQDCTGSVQQEFHPWEMIVDTARIRDELHFRPIFPSFYFARDAGAL